MKSILIAVKPKYARLIDLRNLAKKEPDIETNGRVC